MSPVSAPGAARPVTPTTILAAVLTDLVDRLSDSPGVDAGVLTDLRGARDLAAGLDPYLDRFTSPESAGLAELARRTAAEDWNGPSGNGTVEQEMLSGHVEGRFLNMIVTTARARRVLDIGMFTGYSALAMAEALPSDGRVVALEIDPQVAAFASRCLAELPDGDKVDVRVGPALETLQALAAAGETFDIVFLDADKAGYVDHLTTVLDGGLLADGGLVVVDNTLMQGQPWAADPPTANGAAIARFNAWVADRADLEQVVVPLRDGLTLVRRTEGTLTVQTRTLTPLGVEITDLDVSATTADDVERLRTLLADHGVAVLPDQHVSDEQFLAFLQRFGDMVFTAGEQPLPGFPDLNVISNVGRVTPPRSTFHVDTSYVRRPPAYTALRAVQIPEVGGETLFTDQYRAYETLPADLRDRLAGRTVRHVVTGVELGPDDERQADHPLFRSHPLTGRTSLYLSTTQRCVAISGLPDEEARETLEFLLAHSTREDNTLRHRWRPGDLVMWDNGCVLHKADHSGVMGDRVMHRGMVAGYGR